jgi:hypothetical protein
MSSATNPFRESRDRLQVGEIQQSKPDIRFWQAPTDPLNRCGASYCATTRHDHFSAGFSQTEGILVAQTSRSCHYRVRPACEGISDKVHLAIGPSLQY